MGCRIFRQFPVIAINLDFGGDNHTDAGLARGGDALNSAVGNISNLLSTLATYNLEDKVTFANMAVFGRTLTSKDSSPEGGLIALLSRIHALPLGVDVNLQSRK